MKPFEGVEHPSQPLGLSWDVSLQRLFSTFPNGWPGLGLLLFRVCLGIALVYCGIAEFFGKSPALFVVGEDLVASAGCIFLLAGLWTPLTGCLMALDEVSIGLRADLWIHLFLAVLSLSLAMLGPGAWSVDARLFGRKRFDIDRTRGRRPSL